MVKYKEEKPDEKDDKELWGEDDEKELNVAANENDFFASGEAEKRERELEAQGFGGRRDSEGNVGNWWEQWPDREACQVVWPRFRNF